MNALRGLAETVRTAFADLFRRPLASLTSLLAMAVAVFLLSSFLTLSHGLRAVLREARSEAAVDVYLKAGAEPAAVAALERELAALPAARRVMRVSPAEALAEFRTLYPDLADVDALLGANPFPGSLRVVPDPAAAGSVEQIVGAARRAPVTDSVRYDRAWIDALARLDRAMTDVGTLGALALVLAALATLGAAARLTLEDTRDEVLLLRLVGAPEWLVTGPVLLAGALLGGGGAAAGTALAAAARHVALDSAAGTPLAMAAATLLGDGLAPSAGALLVGLGILCGAIAAFAAARHAAR